LFVIVEIIVIVRGVFFVWRVVALRSGAILIVNEEFVAERIGRGNATATRRRRC
jgi:hypothetical protein